MGTHINNQCNRCQCNNNIKYNIKYNLLVRGDTTCKLYAFAAFTMSSRRHHIGQAPTLHILHDNPEVILPQETVNVIDNIWMLGRAQDENLVDDQVLLRLVVEIHLLDSDGQVGADLVCGVHTSAGALTNFGEIAVEARRVGVITNILETFAGVGTLTSGRSRRGVGGLWHARTRCSSIGGR